MFYNALRRKGWEFGPEDLEAQDMDHIIKIHNANNESAWQEVTTVIVGGERKNIPPNPEKSPILGRKKRNI